MGPIFRRGALIVIEGVDRSGKSTQSKQLVQALNAKNIQSRLINFPDRTTPIGGLISDYLKNINNQMNDEAIHLLFTANRWEKMHTMRTLLESGVTLILDRYSYSGIVYSSIKKNMDMSWCKHVENGLLKPDLVFLLTLPESEGVQRPGFGAERYETEETQQKVAQAFMELAKDEDNWEIINAGGKIEDVHNLLLDKTLKTINKIKSEFQFLNYT